MHVEGERIEIVTARWLQDLQHCFLKSSLYHQPYYWNCAWKLLKQLTPSKTKGSQVITDCVLQFVSLLKEGGTLETGSCFVQE